MAARILVADDDATLQKLLFHALQAEGYEIMTASDGEEALAIVEREQPDLVILDVMMPKIDGFEVCRALRAQPETVTLPVIMLSGLADVEEKVTGLQSGADDYVTKPIDFRELSARVGVLLKRNELLRKAAAKKSAKVVSFIGAKGGVGTTTVAINMAALLAERRKAVITAEMRPDYGTLAAQLKASPEKNLSGIMAYDPPSITEPVVASHLYTTAFDVRILFGPQRLEEYGDLEAGRVAAVLGQLIPSADYVFVDLPLTPTAANEIIIKASSAVFVMLEPEIASVASAAQRLRQLDGWGIDASTINVIVVNRQGTMLLSLREMENRLDHAIAGVASSATEALSVAVQYGMPLVRYQPQNAMAQNLADLVERVLLKPVAAPR